MAENLLRLKFVKKKKMLKHVKCSPNSSRHVRRSSNLLATTLKRFIVEREALKPSWKSEKKPYFLKRLARLLLTNFLRTFLTIDRGLPGNRLWPETFPQHCKIQESQMRLFPQGKTGRELHESARLEFSEKISADKFTLLRVNDNTSGPL